MAPIRALAAIFLMVALLACGGTSPAHSNSSTSPGDASPQDNASDSGSGDMNGSSDAGSTSDGPRLVLPLEVLGSGAPDAPAIAKAVLSLDASDVASASSLYVQCHRCGFYDPPEFEALAKPLTQVKASLRIVGSSATTSDGQWIDITNASVQVEDVALAHGGINGALFTLAFRVALDEATRARLGAGDNRVEFRFNGTDGNSNGYRILDVQFQDGSGHELGTTHKVWADSAAEKTAGKDASQLAQAGEALWSGRNRLVKSPIVPRPIRAACNDCHAVDGRDLQYFNYSNNAIVQRSIFHGLSEEQGKAIAAYLRASLFDKVPHVAGAAPWNPPFQPGTGLDAKPAVEWSAGAGLSAVLPDGKSFIKALVGQAMDDAPLSVTQAELDAAFDPKKTLNTRELPIPLQFPDWNAWLPIVHPLDLWTPEAGQDTGLFETGRDGDPLAAYTQLREWLTSHMNPNGAYGDWSHLMPGERGQLQGMLMNFGGQVIGLGGGSRGTRVSSDANHPFGVELAAAKMKAALAPETAALAPLDTCGPTGQCTPFSTEAFIERADVGLYHWMGIKQWELVETFGLQDQRSFHGSEANGSWRGEGELRGWPFGWPSLFYIAPHMIYAPEDTASGKREFYFSWEKRLVSYYRTDAWYALQVTVNPGWAGASNGGVDWPYTQGFITGLVDDLASENAAASISAAHLARFFMIDAKLGQLANTDIPFDQPDANDPTNIWRNAGLQSKADLLFKLSPTTIMDFKEGWTSKFHMLDELAPGTYLKFVNAMIGAYGALFFATSPEQYRACDANNMQMGTAEPYAGQRFCAERERVAIPNDQDGKPYVLYPSNVGFTTSQFSVWGAMTAERLGADADLVQQWNAWNDKMWPPN